MTIPLESTQTLEMLGLSASQAKIYLNLIVLREATVNKVSKASGIDRGETYRVMTRLVEFGLVEKIIASPLRFKANPLESGLSALFKRRELENVKIYERAQNMIANYSTIDNEDRTSEKEEKTIAVLSADHNANLVNEKLSNVQKYYRAMSFLGEFDRFIKEYYKDCKRLLDKGASLRFIVEVPGIQEYSSNLVESLQHYPNFEVKFVADKIPASLSIYDDREVRIGAAGKKYVSDGTTFWSNNSAFVALAKTCFETFWSRGELRQVEFAH
jgi:sugar-specific transcriptional regulator TrmB